MTPPAPPAPKPNDFAESQVPFLSPASEASRSGAASSPAETNGLVSADPATAPIEAIVLPENQPRIPDGDPAPSAAPPLRWREVLSIVLSVALADVTLYRGEGFAGYAALLLAAPVLLWLGSPRPQIRAGFRVVAAMLLLLVGRMFWLGSVLDVAFGFALVVAAAMAISGRRLYVLDVLACALQSAAAGLVGLVDYHRSARGFRFNAPRIHALSVVLPLAALALFGTLFVLANPDLVASFVEMKDWIIRRLTDWANLLAPSWTEAIFWIVAGLVTIGLIRPILRRSVLDRFSGDDRRALETGVPVESSLYPALRNTLLALIALFVVYLVFEFKTLWFRDFPKNFYYAGYAHQGAAWLTASLAVATVVLSVIFRGRVLRDPRLPRLRRLAWIWSAQNLILAATVYNRLWIYIAFNGMTRMRTVAIFGVSAVVAGVVLVVWKIVHRHDFVWLLRGHLAALAVVVYLFALTPVDAIVHTYNVRRVLAGDLPPSVQISVHPIDAEGMLVLHPLAESDEAIIREGIRALLAQRAADLEQAAREGKGWTAFQLADRALRDKLDAVRGDWADYTDLSKRNAALVRFHQYVNQWY